jgi:hypothetical protein
VVLETGTENAKTRRQRVDYEPTKTANLGDISEVSDSQIPDAFVTLRTAEQPDLADLTEALVVWTKERLGQEQFITALAEFHRLAGTFNFDDSFYHERTSYFLDFFSYQRQLDLKDDNSQIISTPLSRFLGQGSMEDLRLPPVVTTSFQELSGFRHSVFDLVKVQPEVCIIKDLITKQRIEISGQGQSFFRQTPKKLIFQSFIFTFNGKNHVSRGIIYHNNEAAKYIKSNIKSAMKSPNFSETNLLFLLAKQNLSFTRLKRINAKTAYSQGK